MHTQPGPNRERPLVVGIGELLWDMLPGGKQLGGAPTNFAFHARSLGAEAVVASSVGNDALGREILQKLDDLHLRRQYVTVDAEHPTGTVDVTVDASGAPQFTICQNVAWDFIPLDAALLELAAQADAVCFGSLAQRSKVSRETIRRFLSATGGNCLHIFDINLRQTYYTRDVIHQSLEQCDLLKLNDQELPVLQTMLSLESSEPAAIEQLIRQYSLQLVALTRGAAGSRLYTPERMDEHPGYPATVVDSVGAGDAFTAALTAGLLRGKPLPQIHDAANRLASFVCSRPGATPELPPGFWPRE